MNTRRSPRNQERLFRDLFPKPSAPKRQRLDRATTSRSSVEPTAHPRHAHRDDSGVFDCPLSRQCDREGRPEVVPYAPVREVVG